jgi:probable F420-dependent oxidoreductase
MVREIDDLGFDAISVSEHFAMPYFELPRLGAYWMHALSVLAFVAGATRRVRLEATVLVLPYHHPLALAKALATIDVLSGGRLNVSVGVGHAVREFEVLGVPFSERGARADEILDAMNVLWTSDEPAFHGRFYNIDGLAFEPKPVQQPRPPIYIGGNSKPALRRAARHDGWQPNPTNFSIDEVPPLLDYIRGQPEFDGKETTFDLFWLPFPGGGPALQFKAASASDLSSYRDRVLEGVARLDEIGVTRTSLPVPASSSVDEYLDALRWFAQEVSPHAGN